jgi:predicted dinucleotide-binding enzyme
MRGESPEAEEDMKIGVIGSGHIGANAARLFVAAGHEVAISNSRGADTLRDLVKELGPNARAVTAEEAASFGDVVLVAIPFGKYTSLPAEELRGRIVIDANNYYPDRDGHYEELDRGRTTSSEMLAAHLGGARVVKAFNTIWFEHLKKQGKKSAPLESRRAIFIAGDDGEAKGIVSKLIEEIGFGAVDTGSLRSSGRQQPGAAIYNKDVTVDEARRMIATS